jgi:hypothetical protein
MRATVADAHSSYCSTYVLRVGVGITMHMPLPAAIGTLDFGPPRS